MVGVWLGAQILVPRPALDNSLHTLVHEQLDLTTDQKRALESIETAFAAHRQTLEKEMRAANTELAAAIRSSETAGPGVDAAVHHFHEAMGELQTETINHVFAMRRILTPEQRKRFDEKIGEALTSDSQ
jgi:Spy/CpxP family protein refolding chaperone